MLLIIIVLSVFLIVNWEALSQEATVELVFTRIQAPLGVVVVASFAVVLVILVIYSLWQQASVAFELRNAYKEAKAARAAADDAEKSRANEVKTALSERLDKIETLLVDRTDELRELVQNERKVIEKQMTEAFEAQKARSEAGINETAASIRALERKVAGPSGLPAPEAAKKEEKSSEEEAVI